MSAIAHLTPRRRREVALNMTSQENCDVIE